MGRIVLALALACVPNLAAADGRLLDDNTFAVTPGGRFVLDTGLFVGMPAALPTGMSTGVALGLTRNCGCHFAYGLRASWSTVTEASMAWSVSQSDYRVRAVGDVHHDAGRGRLALRLGVGTTVVHEIRTEPQSARTPNPIETHAVEALPAADLEAVVALHVTGTWLAVVSAGPSVDYYSGALRGGWTAELGVGWQP